MKGIILAGGSGTRLYPLTLVTSKQLLPIYDKPMIFYPLSTLMLAGIDDILIISTPNDLLNFQKLLGDGSKFGVKLSYIEQPSPDGLAQAFILGRDFIGNDTCTMILGDNIFYGEDLVEKLIAARENAQKNGEATLFGLHVNDPERFGVVEFSPNGTVLNIEEKPKKPKSNYAVTGLYFYDNRCVEYACSLKPSARGELEITDLNKLYLESGDLNVQLLDKNYTWLDAGTSDSLLAAANFIKTVQNQIGGLVSSPEEIAFQQGKISKNDLLQASQQYGSSPYGEHLRNVANKEM